MQKLLLSSILLVIIAAKPKYELRLQGKYAKDFVAIPHSTPFLMGKAEVTNAGYRQFLQHLADGREEEKLREAMVDSSIWLNALSYGEPFRHYYFQHPAYDNYPVVNISKRGAELYCQWLTETYNATAKQKVLFRLPTEQEWIFAAQAGNTSAKYAWEGESLTYTKKGKWFGEPMCNARIKPVYVNGDTLTPNAATDVTAPAISYLPNGYGLYNICGNVSEMVSDKPITKGGSWLSLPDKLMLNSSELYDGKPSPTVGFRVVAVSLSAVM